MKWVRDSKDCDGIRYFSTHIDKRVPNVLASNFVLPTRDHNSDDYCKHLASLFKFTEPLSWSLAMLGGGPQRNPDLSGNIFLVMDKSVGYLDTMFYVYDSKTCGLDFSDLE